MQHYLCPARLGALLAVTIALSATGAFAGWNPDGVTVRPTAALISQVAASSDGDSGTFVAWQEITTSPVGLLRVQHLLSSGDLDPTWPVDGASASDVAASRAFVMTVPDRQGGVYVCWTEGTDNRSLHVTRVDANGQVANGWPASGKNLGSVAPDYYGWPSVIEDGGHGLFVSWSRGTSVRAQRFGPDGLGAGGWPNASMIVVPVDQVLTLHLWPDLALAPDGGIFLSWTTYSTDTTQVDSGMHLRRLTGAGLNSPGWPSEGRSLGPFRLEILGIWARAPLLDISPDARGGLFVFAGNLWGEVGFSHVDRRLHRLLADGQPSPGWPVDGYSPGGFESYFGDESVGQGLRVLPDGLDGALVVVPTYATHSPGLIYLPACSPGGLWRYGVSGVSGGHELVAKGDGGVFLAHFKPDGPYGPYSWNAFIGLEQSSPQPGWIPWSERRTERLVQSYGDIALAPTGDGGVVFFWSQVRERFGLFARRFSPAGEITAVTGVGSGSGDNPAPRFQLRFVPGTGVVARIALDGEPARLDLFDVSGRRISSRTLHESGPGANDVSLPGTASLASGVYFARLASGEIADFGKVAIAR